MEITSNTRIIDLTVGQLEDLMKRFTQPIQEERRKVYGIAGLASIFNCSTATANRIKKSGRIDKAIVQTGRTIVIDAELALQLYKNNI